MTTLALELNDAELVALGESGATASAPVISPGVAVLDGQKILTGTGAAELARLNPRRTHTRFWSRVDGGALGRPFDADLTHADLAHEHLSDLWRRAGTGMDRVVLVVPGVYSEHQLGLVLGIAEAAGLPVEGLVDAALAAAATGEFGPHMIHVDLRLHDAVLTELTRERELSRRRVRLSDQVGLLPMRDLWAKYLSGLLVKRTRFDPFHAATTEQALYRALEPLLDRLRGEERATIELRVGDRVHAAEVTRGEIADAVAATREGLTDLVRRIRVAGEATTILLSHRAAGIPGLRDSLHTMAQTRVAELPRTAAVDGALRNQKAICAAGETVPYVTRLVLDGRELPGPPAREPTSQGQVTASGAGLLPSPTHLLLDGFAHPITERPLLVGTGVPDGPGAIRLTGSLAGVSRKHCAVFRVGEQVRVRDHSTYGTFLNGSRIDGEAGLAAGDRLQVGTPGVELWLIRVIDREETSSD